MDSNTVIIGSGIFPTRIVDLGGTEEVIVPGDRNKKYLVHRVFKDNGVKQIGVIGWGSQAPAQAQNLRDFLHGTGIKVVVGLRKESKSAEAARRIEFTEENGTLGDMWEVISSSDLVLLLISDVAQVENYKKIFSVLKHGSTLGFSHGFLSGYLEEIGEKFPYGVNVIGVCPKGMGLSVRRLYEQGSGINCSFAVEQDFTGSATDTALAWAIAIGAPYVFKTTLGNEWRSDLFGERAILLGAIHGIVEAVYRFILEEVVSVGMAINNSQQELAFVASAENLTGIISDTMSRGGILPVYKGISINQKRIFETIYAHAYKAATPLLREIYDEVNSGREIRSVVDAGNRLKKYPMPKIADTEMWKVGEIVRMKRRTNNKKPEKINPFTAGAYIGIMMAQIDLLIEKGHSISEVCNESVIEAVDSLNPFMRAKGIDYMVDNCSTTARLGARKWAPRFEYMCRQEVFPAYLTHLRPQAVDGELIEAFKNHKIHNALATCLTLRPSINIAIK